MASVSRRSRRRAYRGRVRLSGYRLQARSRGSRASRQSDRRFCDQRFDRSCAAFRFEAVRRTSHHQERISTMSEEETGDDAKKLVEMALIEDKLKNEIAKLAVLPVGFAPSK